MNRTDFLLALGSASAGVSATRTRTWRDSSSAGYQQEPMRGIVNVLQAGAKGDGKTDDTAAIQAGLDTVASQGGGEVHFPPGKYRLTGTLSLHDNVSLIGSLGTPTTSKGSPVSLLYSGTGSAVQSLRTPAHPGGFLGIRIRGFYLLDDGGKGARGFDLDGFTWCALEDCGIEGFDFGIHTKDDWYARYSNLVIAGARDTGALFSSNANNARFTNIKLSNMAPGAKGCMRLEYAKGSVVDGIGIETNTEGLCINQSMGISVRGIYYENTGTAQPEYAVLVSNSSGVALDGAFLNGNTKTKRGIFMSGDNHAVTVAGAYGRQFQEKDVVGAIAETGMMHAN